MNNKEEITSLKQQQPDRISLKKREMPFHKSQYKSENDTIELSNNTKSSRINYRETEKKVESKPARYSSLDNFHKEGTSSHYNRNSNQGKYFNLLMSNGKFLFTYNKNR